MAGIRVYPIPDCPECGGEMALRRPRPDQDWPAFWGCQDWPYCEGKRRITEDGKPESDEEWEDHHAI